jgi:hypothetical protein
MPIEFQERVLEKMDKARFRSLIGWQNIYDHLIEKKYQPDWQPWLELGKLDQRRGLDSSKIFPEFYKYKDVSPKSLL